MVLRFRATTHETGSCHVASFVLVRAGPATSAQRAARGRGLSEQTPAECSQCYDLECAFWKLYELEQKDKRKNIWSMILRAMITDLVYDSSSLRYDLAYETCGLRLGL